MSKSIVVLGGDGIGPEIMKEGIKVLRAIEDKHGLGFELLYAEYGAESYLRQGNPYPRDTKELCLNADAVLKGPIGVGPEDTKKLQAAGVRLENDALLPLRADLDTYACYRPVVLPLSCAGFSPMKKERLGKGLDIMMIRELVGGIYFGNKVEGVEEGKITRDYAVDECKYTRQQVERFARVCFAEARKRKSKLTNVHKSNILASSRFWNAIFEGVKDKDGHVVIPGVKDEFPDVPYSSMIVDNVAYQLGINPSQFNGIMALENMQGDIITDQAGGILGSLGLMPSACLNPETKRGYYEPSHGSAPDIAGRGIANPYSMIGSVAFMLEKSFGLEVESKEVWNALTNVFAKGFRTKELARGISLEKVLSTSQFGDMVVSHIKGNQD